MKLSDHCRRLVQRRDRRLASCGHALCERTTGASCSGCDANDVGACLWRILTSTAQSFREDKAEPLPAAKRTRDARGAGRYALDGGRVIARDGQPLVRLERVDLGDDRYALSPYETDELAAKIVRLLNRRGAR
jgi:hypothetical protein